MHQLVASIVKETFPHHLCRSFGQLENISREKNTMGNLGGSGSQGGKRVEGVRGHYKGAPPRSHTLAAGLRERRGCLATQTPQFSNRFPGMGLVKISLAHEAIEIEVSGRRGCWLVD